MPTANKSTNAIGNFYIPKSTSNFHTDSNMQFLHSILFWRFFGSDRAGTCLDRSGSSCNSFCTQNQPKRPHLAPFHGHRPQVGDRPGSPSGAQDLGVILMQNCSGGGPDEISSGCLGFWRHFSGNSQLCLNAKIAQVEKMKKCPGQFLH